MRLARGERQEMVQMLSAEGMSTRAIAPIVGADHVTVSRDLAGVSNATPAPVLTDNPGRIVKLTGPNSPTTTTGMDGKTYTRPAPQPEISEPAEPSKPKRPPLPGAYG